MKLSTCSKAGFTLVCCSLLTALLLCGMIIACHFRITALSGHATLALSRRGIASKLNRSQLCVVCRSEQSGEVVNLLTRCCLLLGLLSPASGICVVVQISSSKWQCGKLQASLKAALSQFVNKFELGTRFIQTMFINIWHTVNRLKIFQDTK